MIGYGFVDDIQVRDLWQVTRYWNMVSQASS